MISKLKYLLVSTAFLACVSQASPSYSDTVVHETVTESSDDTATTEQPATMIKTETVKSGERHIISGRGERKLSFADFDLNHDGVLSMDEVAQKMFRIYDLDGNGVIDNQEYEQHTIITFTPEEKTTITSYIDESGKDGTKYTRESFMKESRLSGLTSVKEGLSPHEFIGRDFKSVDVNHDHFIDMNEWRGTYIASLDKKNKENVDLNINK
jgi:Ca2+-binding EF-hand superfamily protein